MVTMTILPNKIYDSSLEIYSDNMILSFSQFFQPTIESVVLCNWQQF